jgi:hypothetical protein
MELQSPMGIRSNGRINIPVDSCYYFTVIGSPMSSKRIASLIVLIVGIIVIIYAVHSMNRISGAKSEIHTMSEAFSGSSEGRQAGNWMKNKAGQYDVPVMILLVSGIVLTVVGAGVLILGKKKTRRR